MPKTFVKLTEKQEAATNSLAAYFNGYLVASNSIGLEIPTRANDAKQFFAAREAVGIRGYMSQEEAKDAIVRTLFAK